LTVGRAGFGWGDQRHLESLIGGQSQPARDSQGANPWQEQAHGAHDRATTPTPRRRWAHRRAVCDRLGGINSDGRYQTDPESHLFSVVDEADTLTEDEARDLVRRGRHFGFVQPSRLCRRSSGLPPGQDHVAKYLARTTGGEQDAFAGSVRETIRRLSVVRVT
jgi:hypothetical protein